MNSVLVLLCAVYTFNFCPTATEQHVEPTHLYWEPVEAAKGYRVYRSSDPRICEKSDPLPGKPYAEISKTTFDDRTPIGLGCYEIAAYNDGGEGGRSERRWKGR